MSSSSDRCRMLRGVYSWIGGGYLREHWTDVLFYSYPHLYLTKTYLLAFTILIRREVTSMGCRGCRKAYPLVQITNSTSFNAFGTVEYASFTCSNDDYAVERDQTWTASSRGVCLVTKISAIVRTPSGNIQAEPYTSSGTSFSRFAIIQVGVNKFQVTRIVNSKRRG